VQHELLQQPDSGNGMYQQRIFITVAMATAWLEKNFCNRPIYQAQLDKFIKHLRVTGSLPATHQGIAFASDGTLLDGQHRLTAIFMSEIGAWQWVCFNVPKPDASFIDGGRPRSMRDRVHNELGRAVAQEQLSIARLMAFGPHKPKAAQFDSAKDAATFLEKHQDAIAFALTAINTRARGIVTSVEWAIVARAYYSQPHADLRIFSEILARGGRGNPQDAEGRDRTVIIMRDAIRGATPLTRYGKVERTLRAFLDNEPLGRIYAAKEELFPLPEEAAAAKASLRIA
jgi:hypothetical protein